MLICIPTTCQQILEKKNNASGGKRKGETNLINHQGQRHIHLIILSVNQHYELFSKLNPKKEGGEKVVRKQLVEQEKLLNRSEQNKPHSWENLRGSCL